MRMNIYVSVMKTADQILLCNLSRIAQEIILIFKIALILIIKKEILLILKLSTIKTIIIDKHTLNKA